MATVGRDIGDIGDVLSRRERARFRPYRGHFCRFIADGLRCPRMPLAPTARSCGIKLAIITARVSPMVERRATELHFDALQMGEGNKTNALRTLCEQEQIDLSQVAYMGDDLNDLGSLQLAGLAIAPANAAAEVKSVAYAPSTVVESLASTPPNISLILLI